MPDDTNSTDSTNDTKTNNTSSGCVYDKWGRTPDKSQICAIGIKSAAADTQSGVVKCVFENKCAKCGQPALMWGWKWSNDSEKVAKFDGTDGVAEGHIYCVMSEGGCDADFSIEGNEHISGSTDKLTIISGPTPSTEEEAQKLSNGQLPCDNSSVSSVSTATGAAAVLIQNVTFYGLIKQIIGAIDGVFIIANNMAYLLSFQDMYKYRDKFEDNIPMIEPKYILHDSYTKQWSPVGCYNSVEVEYADGIIKYQNDALVKQYGENTFYYEFLNDDEETARDKASALLSAHIRDYSSDIHMSILYNENITVGSWVKLPKTVTQIKGRTRQERAQELQKDKKITRKGVNITNITEELVKQSDNSYKKIQHLTDEKGEKTDIELQNKDYDLFFVQGFTCKWNKKHSLMMDIHLKYGPDTPEDPINATISVGQVSSSGTVNTGGSWGDDCFSICDICFEDCRKVLGYGGGRRQDAEEYIRTHEADSKYLAGRAKQGSSYANEVAGKTPQEAYTLFRTKFNYACYSDSCDSAYPCCEDLWDKATAANCGDSTRMLKVLMDATGTPCYGVHVDGHYFNAVQVDGTWHTLDGTRGPTNSSCNFPDSGNYGSGSNSCGSGWC